MSASLKRLAEQVKTCVFASTIQKKILWLLQDRYVNATRYTVPIIAEGLKYRIIDHLVEFSLKAKGT